MPALEIEGAAQLIALAARIEAGGKGLKPAVAASLRAAVQPILGDIKGGIINMPLPVVGVQSTGASHGGGSAARLGKALSKRKTQPLNEAAMRKATAKSGLRAAIASGVGVSLGLTISNPYVRLRVLGTALPSDQKNIPRAIEKGRWRHPVFGHSNAWVTQQGGAFFYPPIIRAIPRIESEVIAACKIWLDGTI